MGIYVKWGSNDNSPTKERQQKEEKVNMLGGWKNWGEKVRARETQGNQRNFIVLRGRGRQARRNLGPSL